MSEKKATMRLAHPKIAKAASPWEEHKKPLPAAELVDQEEVREGLADSRLNPHRLHYFVFGVDCQIYGPVQLPELQEWTKQGSINNESWIYEQELDAWKRSIDIKDLRHLLPSAVQVDEIGSAGISPGQLKRIRLFSDMDDHQIMALIPFLTKVDVPVLKPVVAKGGSGASLFLILSGEAQVSVRVDGVEKTLTTLRAGDFFGEHGLVEASPWPYDVTTIQNCNFLRLKHHDFQTILAKHPDLASRFLTALVRYLSYQNQANFLRVAQAKALSRGSMRQTGQVLSPPVLKK